jgi:riboflavin kinase/FMN adenylyltransferase
MQIHRGYWNLPKAALHGVVAIGNFDGVHRGHRALITVAREQARSLGAPLGVITFEPHPREVLTPDQAPPRLTPFRVKARLLAELGVDHLFALAFTDHLRQKTPVQFVHDVLAGGLGVRQVVVGQDFRFGNRRAGDVEMLAAVGKDYGFGVSRVETVAWEREVCSSSRVRAAIAAGDVALARDLLAIVGDRRGRELGYPTANLCPPRRKVLWPAAGIYAVRARCPGGPESTWQDAVASLGVRPTFEGQDLRLEVHLFDREIDLYGQRICCAFIERLRPEAKFETVEALKEQMALDCIQARAALAQRAAEPHMALTQAAQDS